MKRAVFDSGRVLLGAGFVLLFTVPMVQVYIESGHNDAKLDAMPVAMACWVSENVGQIWPAFAGVIGAQRSLERHWTAGCRCRCAGGPPWARLGAFWL